jgi:hypothetical protein
MSPFGCRPWLLGRPVPATNIRFPHGRPTSGWSAPPDRDGVSMFRTGETRPVSGAPYTPGPWCSHGRRVDSGHHCRLPAAGPIHRCRLPSPVLSVTRLTGIHVIRPSGLPLACGRWMEHRPLGFLPGFTPRRCQRRMPGAGTSVEHSPGANRRTYIDPPFRLSHSHSATSCRTIASEWPTGYATLIWRCPNHIGPSVDAAHQLSPHSTITVTPLTALGDTPGDTPGHPHDPPDSPTGDRPSLRLVR